VEVRVLDEGGKVDLNEAPVELLRGLLIVLGTKANDADALARAISDWRERRAAESRTNPVGNVRFESLGQVARIAGMTPGVLARLEPYLTVDSRLPGIDPWVAPAEVLASVPGIDPRVAANLVRDRPPAYHRQDGGRMAMPSNTLLGPSNGNAFGIEASVEIAGLSFTRRAVFAPGRNGAEPRLLAWR
jgi:general secretion pathway protein K